MFHMRGGRDGIPSIIEMSRQADVVRGNVEQYAATYQEKNSTREDPHCKKCH
jgi:hypothetical protein